MADVPLTCIDFILKVYGYAMRQRGPNYIEWSRQVESPSWTQAINLTGAACTDILKAIEMVHSLKFLLSEVDLTEDIPGTMDLSISMKVICGPFLICTSR
eukprot:CAMPEP_0184294386 /NCGR_PEP_ID=MMETSP1049-20130417/5590_1 /TAXON_ID=77928 /ORGANISM="Proteomonas sulcata, Strain CCMP704" /LENGTH=99 /DNA_ID=CAMNT_0026602655 /DNA_START=81 /DNA_END=380 /DNA_ORIENTATION=+